MYAQFDLQTPADLNEALRALSGNSPKSACVPLAGGTNLIVDIRARGTAPDSLLTVARLAGLSGIEIGADRVVLGGATTVSEFLRHPGMAKAGAALVDAAKVFAGQMVRNTATVAGNICYGSPAADLVPPLMALDATVTLQNASGSRDVQLSEFFTGYKSMVRQPEELLTRVSWPTPPENAGSCFYKLARRKGDAITVVGVAVSLTMDNGICTKSGIALGAVGPTVFRARQAEALLEGNRPTPDLIEAVAESCREATNPIDDIRASGAYRKQQVQVLVRRLLAQLCASLAEGK